MSKWGPLFYSIFFIRMENLVTMGKKSQIFAHIQNKDGKLVKMEQNTGGGCFFLKSWCSKCQMLLTWSAGLPGDVWIALVTMGTALTATTLVTSRTVTTRDKVVSVEETFRRKPAGERYRWRNIFFYTM